MAREETSPALPPILPRNISRAFIPVAGFVPSSSASLTWASGVALVTRSGIFMLKTLDTLKNILLSARLDQSSGATKLVITLVHAKSRKIRADMAGLAKFLPIPPKSIFAITMANSAPTTGTYIGTTAGRLSAKMIPVTTAERSPTVCSFFLMRLNKNSNNTQKPTQTSVFKSG